MWTPTNPAGSGSTRRARRRRETTNSWPSPLAPGYGSRLGQDRPRRRSARGRNLASTRTGDPGPPPRPARPASPGRRGVRLRDPTRPRSGLRTSYLGRRSLRRPNYWWARVNDIPAWPKPATTDADGRFTMHGVGRRAQDSGSASSTRDSLSQMIDVETDDAPDAKSVTMALQPAKIFTGRVTYADTGKPVPHARLEISASARGNAGSPADQLPDRCRRPVSREPLAGRSFSMSGHLLPPGNFTSPLRRESIGPRARSSSRSTCPFPGRRSSAAR